MAFARVKNAVTSIINDAVNETLSSEAISYGDLVTLEKDINVIEEITVHKAVVAFRMLFRQTDIFVHVEGDNVLKADLACFTVNRGEYCVSKAGVSRLGPHALGGQAEVHH